MSNWNRGTPTYGQGVTRVGSAELDQGLRAFMLGVYNNMVLGLALTGLAALGVYMAAVTGDQTGSVAPIGGGLYLTQFGYALFASPLKWVAILAPLAMVFFISFRIEKLQAGTARTLFLVYAGLMGVSISSIFLVYTQSSIVQVFFITAAAFGGLSLYGYTTRRDLSAMGSFLIMGLLGLVLASIVNIFMQSSGFQFVVSILGVLIFAGLTAWDTQRIKEMYYNLDGGEIAAKKSVLGALSLYLNFINMFMFLLQLFGVQRND